jgi:hypothetical protein
MKNAYEVFRDAARIFKSDEPIYSKSFYGLLVLMGAGARVVLSFSRSATPEERAEVKRQVLQAWHEEVTAIDLPLGKLDLFEPIIDNAIEMAVSSGWDVIAGKIDSLNADIDALLTKVGA